MNDGRADEQVLAFNAGGSRPPLIMLETFPARGQVKANRLAAALGPDQPFYELRPPAITADRDLRRIDQWIDHFLARLRELPVGPPYALLGFSFGGLVAIEVASRLRDEGRDVAYVGLIDTWRPERHPKTTRERLVTTVAEMQRRPPGTRADYVRGQVRSQLRHWRTQIVRRIDRARGRAEPPPLPLPPRRQLRNAIWIAWLRYRVRPVEFAVSIYWCASSAAHFGGDPTLGWAPWLLGGFEQSLLDGEHETLFSKEHVGGVAAAVERSLTRAFAFPVAAVPPGHIPQRV